MKKLAILFAIAALSACSDSSDGQSPAGAAPSATDKGVSAAPSENTTTPKTDALPSSNNSGATASSDATAGSGETPATVDPAIAGRWDEIQSQYVAARDAFREARSRWEEKEDELKNAVASNSPDVDRLKEEVEQLRLAFVAAQEKFTPIYEEREALKAQIDALRVKN
jgi:outer membrane protein TolC